MRTEVNPMDHLKGKVIVNFGDSIFGNKRPPHDISTALAEVTGATVHNLGFGGCRMSCHVREWAAFSMYRIADAITTRDFSIQDAVDVEAKSKDVTDEMPIYFLESRALLKSLDFNQVDIVTIAYGSNDYTARKKIDNPENPFDVDTFQGALRYSIKTLHQTYPHLKIFVCSPTYRFWVNDNLELIDDSDTRVYNGHKMDDFIEATKQVAKEYHVKFIDNYYELGINKFSRTYYFDGKDGSHHNPRGARLIAEHMASELF